jgi:hypothetical protein
MAATNYQTDHGASRYYVPIISGNSAQLFIDDKTVTYGCIKTIQNAYAFPRLHQYIGKTNTWSSSTMTTIDWISLGAACNRNHSQRHFVVKLSHDLLPTRSRTKKYDPDSPSHCIYCNDTGENCDHLIRCNHPTCSTWRSDLLRTIRSRGDTIHTDPVLLDLLIASLHACLHHQPSPLPAAYPAAYWRLVR